MLMHEKGLHCIDADGGIKKYEQYMWPHLDLKLSKIR